VPRSPARSFHERQQSATNVSALHARPLVLHECGRCTTRAHHSTGSQQAVKSSKAGFDRTACSQHSLLIVWPLGCPYFFRMRRSALLMITAAISYHMLSTEPGVGGWSQGDDRHTSLERPQGHVLRASTPIRGDPWQTICSDGSLKPSPPLVLHL
jgi:hypothetical protein